MVVLYIRIFKKCTSLLLAFGMIYFFYQIPNQKFLMNSYLHIPMQNHYLNEAESCLESLQEDLFKQNTPNFNLSGLGYSDETFSAADMCLRRYGKSILGLEDYNSFKSIKENFLFKEPLNQTITKETRLMHIQYILSALYPTKIKFYKEVCPFLNRAVSEKTQTHTLLLICYNFTEKSNECFNYKNKKELYSQIVNLKVCNETI